MIRITKDEIQIWWQLTSDRTKRMTWNLDTFLQAANGQSPCIEAFKTRLVHLGKIETMTEQDYDELNQRPPKRAGAAIELASQQEIKAIAASARSEG